MTQKPTFKTPEGKAEYLAAYDAAMKLWPVPYEEIDIPGRFGMTHVIISGPQDAPPLMLLHGMLATSTMWLPNIANFSKAYRVYAIDTIGQPGKSIPNPDDPVRDAADYAAWLGEILDKLNLDRIFLAGMSFGGWIALKFAMTAPERVRKLVLLSPAGFLPLVKQFFLRGMPAMMFPTRFTVSAYFGWMGFKDKVGDMDLRQIRDLLYLGVKHFRMPPETARIMPTPLSDDELRAVEAPTLLLFGEHEVIYDPAKALARARLLIPNLDGELLPDSSHEMCASQHQIVDARVCEFLNHNESPVQTASPPSVLSA